VPGEKDAAKSIKFYLESIEKGNFMIVYKKINEF
jgi:hypothetical protein